MLISTFLQSPKTANAQSKQTPKADKVSSSSTQSQGSGREADSQTATPATVEEGIVKNLSIGKWKWRNEE